MKHMCFRPFLATTPHNFKEQIIIRQIHAFVNPNMLGKIVRHLWNARKEFVKYFTIGICAYLTDIFSLYFLKEVVGLSGTLAVVINQPPLIMGVFFMNKYWSFGAGGLARAQAVKFLFLTLFNYVFSIVWMLIWHDYFEFQYLLVRTVNIALSVGWNFLLYKHWVYRS